MELKKAERKRVKLRLNIASPSGFGKTYSALRLAYGITGSYETIAVIDTEQESSSLYSHLGNFNTIKLDAPYTAARYIEAIKLCEKAGMGVIIIDSCSHVWNGVGGILEYQNSLGGRYQDWAKATPIYQSWLNAILQSSCHIITTLRKKQAYNMITENNRTKIEKAGLEDEIRSGYEYEMTVALEIINDKHLVRSSKDRTGLFVDKPEFLITEETGRLIKDWCEQGDIITPSSLGIKPIQEQVVECKTVEELLGLYHKQTAQVQQQFNSVFTEKRKQLMVLTPNQSGHISQHLKSMQNGTGINA
jgi:hypothetical protein